MNSADIARRATAKALNASTQVSVHGLAFGKDADLDMLRLISAGSGGIASRIFDGASMDTQVRRDTPDLWTYRSGVTSMIRGRVAAAAALLRLYSGSIQALFRLY